MDDNYGKIPISYCPKCHRMLDAATDTDREKPGRPEPHDVSVCLYCHSVLEFDEDLFLRHISEETFMNLDVETLMVIYKSISIMKHIEMEKK